MLTTEFRFGAQKADNTHIHSIDGTLVCAWASKFDTGGKVVSVQGLHAVFAAASSARVKLGIFKVGSSNGPGTLVEFTQERVGVQQGPVEFMFPSAGADPSLGGGWSLKGSFWLGVFADGPVQLETEPAPNATDIWTYWGNTQYQWNNPFGGGGGPDTVQAFADSVRLAVSAWGFPPYEAPLPDFSEYPDVAVVAAPATVQSGSAATSNVTISQYGGTRGTLVLTASNLPTGTTVYFDPPTVELPGGADVVLNSTAHIIASADAPAYSNSTVPAAVTGTLNGTLRRACPFQITVTRVGAPPPPVVGDFALIAPDPAITLQRGVTDGPYIEIAAYGGIVDAIEGFTATGLPTGVTLHDPPYISPAAYLDASDSNQTATAGYARRSLFLFDVAADAPLVTNVPVVVTATRHDTGTTRSVVVSMSVQYRAPVVRFGGVDATDVVVIDDHTVEVTAPRHRDTFNAPAGGPVAVRVLDAVTGFDSNTNNAYTYDAPTVLRIDSVSPTTVATAGGTVVQLVGVGFHNVKVGIDAQSFGYEYVDPEIDPADIVINPAGTEMFVTMPAHAAGDVSLDIWRTDNAHAGVALTYGAVATFRIDAVNPITCHLSGGATITVTGAGFQVGAELVIDGTVVTTTYSSATQVSGAAPARSIAGLVNVSVRNPGGATVTKAAALTYEGMVVTDIDPASLTKLGGTILVNGRWFTSNDFVTIGTSPVPTTFISSTQLRATVPALTPGRYDVKVASNPPGYVESYTLSQALLILSVATGGPGGSLLFIVT